MSNTETQLELVADHLAYERYLSEAMALAPAEIEPCRCDPNTAFHNVKKGVLAVLEHETELATALPEVNVAAIRDLPNLALGLAYAAGRVNRLPEATELREILPRVSELRRRLLSAALALAECELLPEREVEVIRRGKGSIDAASDASQLAGLFERYAAEVAGKHPILDEEIAEAHALGTRARSILQPASVAKPGPRSAELARSVEIRDRLWTLLVQRYRAHLWRAGAWVFGPDVDQHVPSLLARVRRPQPAPEPPSPPVSPAS